jgi:dihydroorotase (multifunctional complex type)
LPSILIESTKVLVGNELTPAHLLLTDGVIKRICKLRPTETADLKIDGARLIALPGMIDAHVHLRDLELSYKETFETGTQAAAVGGFTTVLDMPNTRPPTTNRDTLLEKMSHAKGRLFVNVGFQGALVDETAALKGMRNAGAVAFKLYMNKALETFDSSDNVKLNRALRAARECNALVTVHAEDGAAIRSLQERSMAQGRTTIRDFLRGHSPGIEITAVRRILGMTSRLGVRAHVCHITIPDAVRLVRIAQNTSCEATAHHLLMNQSIFKKQGTLAICVPPIRSERHRRGLWRLFRDGRVDILASDHAPHTLEEKSAANAWKAASGVPGLETSLPALFTQISRRRLNLRRLVEATATLPAKIFRLGSKGVLKEGYDADIVLVDPKAKIKIRPEDFLSKAKYSPFKGMRCTGRAAYTIVNGQLVAEKGSIVGPAIGKVVVSDA